MSNPYTLICNTTGMVKGKITCDEHLLSSYENDDTTIIEGHHCFRSKYRCLETGRLKKRLTAKIKSDVEVATPGTTIQITKPDDCWIMVEGEVTLNSTFVTGTKDFRATAVGRYTGEIHVVVRSEEEIRSEQMRVAFEQWFSTTPEGQAAFQAAINTKCQSLKGRLHKS